MVKKLLCYRGNILFFFFFWTAAVFGQECPTSVSISASTATTICEGTEVTFTANATGGDNYTYQWQVNGTDLPGATSVNFITSSLTNTDVIKVIVSTSTEPSCIGVESNLLEMTVNPHLEAYAEIHASSTSVCPGETVVYSIGDISNHGGSQAKYEWLINGSSFASPETGSTLSYEPSANEEITLKLDSGLPCVDDFVTAGITVTIKAGKPAAPGSISGENKVCPGISTTYSITPVTNASSYIWELPTGWTGTSSSSSITVTSGTSGGEIRVSAQNECGTGTSQSIALTVDPGKPAQPAAITGNSAVCPGTSETYSVPAVTNATKYTWTFPAGWNLAPVETSTPQIDITTGASGNGNISVIASNNCGDSAARTLGVTMQPGIPDTPGAISGNTEVCPGVQEIYSVGTVARATEYVWTLPDGTEQITTTPTITVTTNSSGTSNVSLIARNSCGSSSSVSKAVTVKAGIPANAGDISLIYNDSSSTICPGGSLNFSVTAPTGAESFVWTVPPGWTITGGDGTSQISVTAGQYGENGTVTVKPSNSCGTGTASSLAVSVDPDAPEMGSTDIDGPPEVCATSTGLVYSIPAINHANSYSWTVPMGWNITSAANGNSITVNPSATSGDITVTAINDCGSSETIAFPVAVTAGVPAQPGAITSSNYLLCPPAEGIVLSVANDTSVDGYEWFLPSGWEITNGENTNSITVRVNASASYSNPIIVGVEAYNICGNSPRSNTPSDIKASNAIAVSNFVFVDMGEDMTLCRNSGPVEINTSFNLGGKSLKVTSIVSSSGNTYPLPNGSNKTHKITYTPTTDDLAAEEVTITLTTETPGGVCGPGKDQITIFFRDDPTVEIAETSEICMGSSTELTFTGTPNTVVTYAAGGTDKTINIGDNGTAILNTGNLSQTTTYTLKSVQYSEAPSCPVTITGSATVTVNPHPIAEFTAFATEYCNADLTTYTPGLTLTGTHSEGGFTSSSPALAIDPQTGAFSPSGVPAGTYTITYTFDDILGCGYQSVSTDITIYEKVTITTQPGSHRICEGQPLELSVGATGDGLTYEWHDQDGVIAGATAATLNIPSASLTDEGTYYVIVSGTDPCEAVTSASVEVLVDSNISITSLSPDTSVCETGQVSFSVEAEADGEVLSYQWLKDGSPLTGEINATLTLDPVQPSDAAIYTIMLSGASGFVCNSLTSDPIVLTVRETPSVGITGDAEICDGGSSVINFANGLPNGIVSYNINGGSSSTIQLDASGNASLNTGSLAYSTGTTTDYIFSLESISYPEAPDCITPVTGAVTIKVSPIPAASFAFTDDQVAFCNSASATSLTPVLTGTPGGTFSAAGLTVDPQTGAFSPAGIAAGNYTVTYSIPASGGCTEETATLDITIHKEVKITSQPFNTGICSGETTQFEVSATGDNLAYQWYRGNVPGTAITGATSNILKISPASMDNDGSYYVVVSGAGSCSEVISNVVTLNVDENIIISTQPVDQEVCLGADVTFSISATATGGEPIYQWQKDGVDLTGKTGTTLELIDVTLADAGEYTVFVEGPEGYTCSTITSGAALLTINEPPTVEAGENFTACYTTQTIDISGGASASLFSSIEWSHDGAGVLSDPNVLEATYTPATDESGTVTFTLTAFGNTCAEVTDTKTLEIEPVPVITAFSYAAREFCQSDTELKTPNITGSNAYSGGTFAMVPPTGLSIDAVGTIDPASSDPGIYEIIYSTPAGAVCDPVQSDPVTVVIGEEPIADFAYDNTIYCKDTRDDSQNIDPVISMLNGATPGTFSYSGEGTLGLNTTTGEIDLNTSTPGVYMVTNTHDYTGEEEDGCALVSFDFEITITEKPIPDFTYLEVEFCSDGVNPVAQFTVPAVAGAFTEKSGNSGLVFADTATGEIDLASSTPGTYVIVNTVAAANGCTSVSAEQEITITKKPEVTFAYSKVAYCFSEGVATVTYPEGYANDVTFSSVTLADFLNEDTGEVTWTSANAAPIVGNHSISFTITGTGGCTDITGTIPLVIDAVPVGGKLDFGDFGRVYTTCENPANIDVSLTLSEFTGTILRWEYRNDSTLQWTEVSSTESSLSGVKLNEIVSYESLVFRAVVANGACTAPAYSATAIIGVIPTDIEPAPVKVDPVVLCYGNEISLSSETGYGSSFGKFDGGAFTNAGIKKNGWDFSAGDYTFDRDNGVPGPWGGTQPKWKFITANLESPYTTYETWWNSHPTEQPNEHFAIAQGTYSSTMEPPVFSLTGMDEAVFVFDQAYNLTPLASIKVEISLDGGATYSKVLYEVEGPAKSGNEDHFSNGTPGKNQIRIDLGEYLGQTNLRLRFNYIGVRPGDIWAVDNITVPDGPQGVQLIWYYDDDTSNPDNPLEQIGETNQEQVNFKPRKIGWNDFEVKTALLLDSNGEACESLENSKTIRVFVFDQYTTSVEVISGSCGANSAELIASVTGELQLEVPASETTIDGYKGEWEITPPTGASYVLKNQDETSGLEPLYDPHVILESEDLGDFIIKWVLKPTATYPLDYEVIDLQGDIIENTGCPPDATEATLNIVHCTTLDFDGVNDYIDLGAIYNDPNVDYSIEAWIRPFDRPLGDSASTNALAGTIISGPSFEITMADLAGKVAKNDRWYHIAVSEGKLFVDGIPTGTTISGTGGSRTLIGARWETEAPQEGSYFSGWIEEVRIWNTPLSVDEIRFMMNQRIKLDEPTSTTPVDGEVVHVKNAGSFMVDGDGFNEWEEVAGDELENNKVWYKRNWGNLEGYYRLISADPDPLLNYLSFGDSQKPAGGVTPNFADPANPGKLHNMETHQQNTSPTPYVSYLDGATDTSKPWRDENTWLRPDVWDYPNATSNDTEILWNIAKTRDNIHSGSNDIWLLGLLVESGELEIQNSTTAFPHWTDPGQMLRVTHYLNLQGVIDLNGESQLLQNSGSIIDTESTGSIEIDQQGTASSYNYNYWTSPVSPVGVTGNAPYIIKAVMKDGTTPIPVDLDFGYEYHYADGPATNPRKVSSYWLWEFHGDAGWYNQWHYVGEDSEIDLAAGYSMKGTSGEADWADPQNYTFKGMPGNGEIKREIFSGQMYLLGNPFPSALDAEEFILDNNKNISGGTGRNSKDSFNGSLYFWSHFAGKTHYLEEYVGGYAVFNLSGSTEARATDSRINAIGDKGGAMPEKNIPVGQGFYINSRTISGRTFGGEFVFKNSQRVYQRELDGESVFHSQEILFKEKTQKDNREKIWLNFNSPSGYNRQLLVTADPVTTNNFDLGYDAPLIETNKEDMYWIFQGSKFVIQGVAHFNEDQELPLGLKVQKEELFTISIDKLKNVPDDKPIYLKDSLLNKTHNLRKGSYKATAPEGVIENRFKIVFRLQETPDEVVDLPDEEDEVAEENGDVEILTGIELMYLTNSREIVIRNPQLIDLQDMVLNNVLGQKVHEFFELPLQKEVKLPVRRIGPGVYIVRLRTDKGVLTEKIIIE